MQLNMDVAIDIGTDVAIVVDMDAGTAIADTNIYQNEPQPQVRTTGDYTKHGQTQFTQPTNQIHTHKSRTIHTHNHPLHDETSPITAGTPAHVVWWPMGHVRLSLEQRRFPATFCTRRATRRRLAFQTPAAP